MAHAGTVVGVETLNEYVAAEKIDTHDHRKTKVWNIVNRRSNRILGVVRWYGPWHQYTFQATGYAIFNNACLLAITKFLDDQNTAQRRNRD